MNAQPTSQDRLMQAIRQIIRAEMAQLVYGGGPYEYTVSGVNGDGSVNALPTDPTLTLPAITNVPMRSSTLGGTSKPTPGNRCLVEFVNQDSTRPIIVGADRFVQSVK